jgi:hypothetical protein
MNRRIFFISAFCFLLFAYGLSAQDTWIQTYQPFGDVNYFPEDIVVCQDGGYAVNGYYFYTDGMFFEEFGFIIKTDSDGNLLWADLDIVASMVRTRSNAFVETSNGDFISIGWNDFNANYIAKRDSEGNLLWAEQYDFETNSMCKTIDDQIIIGGNLGSIALRKIDNDGNEIWTKSYQMNENYSVCKSIIQTIDEGYLLTGYGYFENQNTSDILVMKTDSNGDSLWTRTYDGYGYFDFGKSVAEDLNGNIMIAGQLGNPNTIGFLWYLDENGNTIWTQEVNNSIGYSHYSVLSIPNGSFTTICQTSLGSKLYNYDTNYYINWNNVFTGWSGRGDKPIRLLQNIGYIYCLERVGGNSVDNIGIAKTDSQGNVTAIDTFELSKPTNNISNFPNPFNPETTISFNLTHNIENARIEIFNVKGEKIKVINCQNQTPIIWDGTDNNRNPVSSGVYLYRIKTDEGVSISKKMLLLK